MSVCVCGGDDGGGGPIVCNLCTGKMFRDSTLSQNICIASVMQMLSYVLIIL